VAVIFVKKKVSPTGRLFSPMLAADSELGRIAYPKIALPKLNGVRGVNQDGLLMPRSLKHGIKNNHTRAKYSHKSLSGIDGELVVGDFADENVFVSSTSGVGTVQGLPQVVWYVFDIYHPTLPYKERLKLRDRVVEDSGVPDIVLIPWVIVTNDKQMVEYSSWALSQGYEGLVLRDPNASYKEGRSTELEGGFQRYCPWLKGEATILSINEGEVNNNKSVKNALGFLAKSSHKANKVGSGMAGSVTVRDLASGVIFNMPVPGVELQKEMFNNPEKFMARVVHYKYKPAVKTAGKPRFPQIDKEIGFVGFREAWDMS